MAITKGKDSQDLFVQCGCNSMEHVVRFQIEDWSTSDDVREFELDVTVTFLTFAPWYRRLATAIKYLFKKDASTDYPYCNSLWGVKETTDVRDFLNKYLELSATNTVVAKKG